MTDLQLVPPSEDDREASEHLHLHHQSTQDRHRIAQLANLIANSRIAMKPLHRHITEHFFQGHTKLEIQTKLQTTNITINKTLQTTKAIQHLALMAEIEELRCGPSLRQRRNMLWRIAQNNEQNAPTVSQKSIDLLNKQEGIYTPDTNPNSQGLTVNVQNFQVNVTQTPEHAQTIKDVPTTLKDFVTIPVEVP